MIATRKAVRDWPRSPAVVAVGPGAARHRSRLASPSPPPSQWRSRSTTAATMTPTTTAVPAMAMAGSSSSRRNTADPISLYGLRPRCPSSSPDDRRRPSPQPGDRPLPLSARASADGLAAWPGLWSRAVVALGNWVATLLLGRSPSTSAPLPRPLRQVCDTRLRLSQPRRRAVSELPGQARLPDRPHDRPARSSDRWSVGFRMVSLFRRCCCPPSSPAPAPASTASGPQASRHLPPALAGGLSRLVSTLARGRMPRGLRACAAYWLCLRGAGLGLLLPLTGRYPDSDPLTIGPLPVRTARSRPAARRRPAAQAPDRLLSPAARAPASGLAVRCGGSSRSAPVLNWFATLIRRPPPRGCIVSSRPTCATQSACLRVPLSGRATPSRASRGSRAYPVELPSPAPSARTAGRSFPPGARSPGVLDFSASTGTLAPDGRRPARLVRRPDHGTGTARAAQRGGARPALPRADPTPTSSSDRAPIRTAGPCAAASAPASVGAATDRRAGASRPRFRV